MAMALLLLIVVFVELALSVWAVTSVRSVRRELELLKANVTITAEVVRDALETQEATDARDMGIYANRAGKLPYVATEGVRHGFETLGQER